MIPAAAKFDICLANPPYSISQWDRKAFENDKYGRNFLGVPPQGRADYAFIQHILKSLKPKSGRCAILLPHGVLFRNEEQTIREKLIKSDLVECIIGIGKNLFFNSPMEACILVCRTKKSPERIGKIMFINAKDLVTRKNGFSYLEDEHISKILEAYKNYKDIEGFCSIRTQSEILANDSSLSIPLYVKMDVQFDSETELVPTKDSYEAWKSLKTCQQDYISDIYELIEGENKQ